MSTSQHRGHRAKSSISQTSRTSERVLFSPPVQPNDHYTTPFEPCAATASFFLYAQRNIILSLHHDTLALERRFEQHKSDVLLISADNVSERGAGRLIVSYDADQTAIVWDLLNGNEVARFVSYEPIYVATWMRDGSIAFGNHQGNIILFEPSSSEHVSARTIYTPVTALAPASDCTTFAIGYMSGSILVATLQPTFTILHTLSTSRAPSPIVGLAWHGSSAKQKAEMLAIQMADGDLRVWSVSKSPQSEAPRIIRILREPDAPVTHQNWCCWSKNGRIVQHSEGDTRACDVRAKNVITTSIPTIDHVVAISAYGPSGTLFTVGRNHSVQQYDLVSQDVPVMVANVQHVPPNAPPTPPDSIEESKRSRTVPLTVITSEEASVPTAMDAESSEEEGHFMSPLQKIAQDRYELNEEQRDHLTPLSPYSSRGSMSSASSNGRERRHPSKSHGGGHASGSTLFSMGSSQRSGTESPSIRSTSSTSSSRHARSALRHEVMRSPEETKDTKAMDLFPSIKTRLTEVKFRAPKYGQASLTPDVLRKEMLSVVFGWEGDIEDLIREEQSCHRPGSASGVLLSKWLGELGADTMAQMIGSESMTSSDWMILALSCQMGQGSQKKVGEAFVKRLLETGEIHPAVAILLGLGEQDEAVEVYVSRKFYMEAVLLTCLIFPNDWQRQSHLVRKWGELAVSHGQPELAVRCFSCTTIESSEPWFSPRAQDAIYQAQQQALAPHTLSPPASPPSATTPHRLAAKMASLKLITKFGDQATAQQSLNAKLGVTPIADTAVTPGTHGMWRRDQGRDDRDRSHSRTATPGGIGRRRLPSSTRDLETESTPLAGSRITSRRATPALSDVDAPNTAVEIPHARRGTESGVVPTRQGSRPRNMSKDRNHHGLQIDLVPTIEVADVQSPDVRPPTGGSSHSSLRRADRDFHSRPQTSDEVQTNRLMARDIDKYIDSLEGASPLRHRQKAEQSLQSPSRNARSRSRSKLTETGDTRRQYQPTYIKRSRRSPSSPIPMTADEAGKHIRTDVINDDNDRSTASPLVGRIENERSESRSARSQTRNYSELQSGSPERRPRVQSSTRSRQESRTRARKISPRPSNDIEDEDAQSHKLIKASRRSPTSPQAMELDRSITQQQVEQSSEIRVPEREQRDLNPQHEIIEIASPVRSIYSEPPAEDRRTPRTMSRKELAARELEERRLSLARRPSVPTIVHPAQLSAERFRQSPRSGTDPGPFYGMKPFEDVLGIPRSHTVGPEVSMRNPASVHFASPTSSTPPIGLPATPKVMQQAITRSVVSTETSPVVNYLPSALPTLEPVSYTWSPVDHTTPSAIQDSFGPPIFLTNAVFNAVKPPIIRSYSAPPTNFPSGSPNLRKQLSNNKNAAHEHQSRSSPRRDPATTARTHVRKASEIEVIPEVSTSFEAGLHDPENSNDQVIIVEETERQDGEGTPVLAELAHLAGPPPPPPPPTMFQPLSPTRTSGIIDIVIDDHNQSDNHTISPPQPPQAPTYPTMSSPTHTQSPYASGVSHLHRRLSNSGPSTPSITSKWRTVTDRMRSSSRNRTKSPPVPGGFEVVTATAPFLTGSPPPAPYETIVSPGGQFGRASLSMSPPVGLGMGRRESFGGELGGGGGGGGVAAAGLSSGQGYLRTPREIRANMPPGTLQAGAGTQTQMQGQSGTWGYLVRGAGNKEGEVVGNGEGEVGVGGVEGGMI